MSAQSLQFMDYLGPSSIRHGTFDHWLGTAGLLLAGGLFGRALDGLVKLRASPMVRSV